MNLGLASKHALVTGSTAGIGFATARSLAGEGAHVTINGRTRRRVEEAVSRIQTDIPGARVDGIALDLAKAEGCRDMVAQLPEVDILVNNLGIFEPKPFEQISDEDWLRFFETNVLSGVRLSRHYVTGMRSRNWGRIVFVSSEPGAADPGRDDPLRYDKDRAARRRAWPCRNADGHWCQGEQRAAPGPLRRRVSAVSCPILRKREASIRPPSSASSSPSRGPHQCCSASQHPKRRRR